MGPENPHYQSIAGTWLASYACGIRVQHLAFSDNVLKQVTSLTRSLIYFTIRRIMREFTVMKYNGIINVMNKYGAFFLKDHIPKWTWQELWKTVNPEKGVTKSDDYRLKNYPEPGSIKEVQNDFRKFVQLKSNDITKNGTKLVNQSVEAYLYAVLGSQARSKQSIISNKTSALEVQKVFRQIFEDSVINYDVST